MRNQRRAFGFIDMREREQGQMQGAAVHIGAGGLEAYRLDCPSRTESSDAKTYAR